MHESRGLGDVYKRQTKRGKGTKCMVLVERQGIPLGICLAAASPAEVTLVHQTLAARVTPRRRQPHRLIGDRAYDSDPLRERLAKRRHHAHQSLS